MTEIAAEAAPRRPAWGPKHVGWGLLAVVGLLLVETICVSIFDPHLDSLAATLVLQLLFESTLAGVAFGFASLPGSGLAPAAWLGLRRVGFTSAWEAIAIAIFSYLVFSGVYGSFVHAHQEDVARDLGYGSSPFGAASAAILIVLAAPVGEELFFRGFVFGGLRRRLPLWPAALLAGGLFGMAHFTGGSSIGVVPQLAFLGVALCWVYDRTGSLWPTIAIHVLNNLIAFIVTV